jgi:hypothetical protein
LYSFHGTRNYKKLVFNYKKFQSYHLRNSYLLKIWKMLDLQHQYNNCTTTSHMRVTSRYWGLPSYEGLLCSCCIGVVLVLYKNQIPKDFYVESK